ncbi:hypothetical protein [Pseudoduganella danionis]|uniref:hypothetical protein n=1 Tax=Pseudoduganella danionis TaxID=1890295 RepID=UPI0035B05FE0
MTKPSTPVSKQPASSPEREAAGPQNEAERRLQALILDGVNSGPAAEVSIAELSAELRQRLIARP